MKKVLFFPKIFLLIFTAALLFPSCIKKDAAAQTAGTLIEQYFESSVLNQNFIISLATNNGTDLTANYNGYTFKMLKTDYYHGPMQAAKGSNTYTGTWSANEDYSKLIVTLPTIPSEFNFLIREWRFTKKELPQLELAPWGTTEPIVLHMLRQ